MDEHLREFYLTNSLSPHEYDNHLILVPPVQRSFPAPFQFPNKF